MIKSKELLKRLLTDKLNEEDKSSLFNDEFVEKRMKKQWNETDKETISPLIERRIWNKIEKRTISKENVFNKKTTWIAIAASIVVVFGLFSIINKLQEQTEKRTFEIYADACGVYTLPDNSKVWIDKGDTIRYTADFGKGVRKVWMKGEAMFDVAKREGCPFIVYFGNSSVQVYGTKFAIKDSKANSSKVVLYRGSVGFASDANAKKVMMKPGEILTYNKVSGEINKKLSDLSDYDWNNEAFYFSDKPLIDLLRFVEQNYEVNISLDKSRQDTVLFSGTIRQDESLDEVLEKICITMDLKSKKRDDSIILY